jgi:hypothetical protein
MTCHHVTLSFARKDDMDLYVVEGAQTLDVFTGCARTKECFWASRLDGRRDALSLDQRKTPILWEKIALPAFCRTPEGDGRREAADLADISYAIANAMNRTIRDRGFSRFVRKQIVGSWISDDSKLEFAADQTYRIIGSAGPIKYSPPQEGRWSAGGRMLHLMTEANDGGVRVALVSVSASELRFHGEDGALFHVYQRA